jgi:hypothetical protein
MTPTLGKLQRINLRDAWKHEASEFTPWLAQTENLDLLAEALGLVELELVGSEHWVGDFKLDLLCSDDGGQVIIENQLERTNHNHLGQIITYAAGVGARKVIWLAESFRTEHVAALEFLNQHTTEDLSFFAVEVELWRIGDSPMAPSFNVLVKPNDWTKSSRESAKVATVTTPTKQRQLKFWTEWKACDPGLQGLAAVNRVGDRDGKAPLPALRPTGRHALCTGGRGAILGQRPPQADGHLLS